MSRNVRQLHTEKQSRVLMERGIPSNLQGKDGDFRLNLAPDGVKLYAKFNGQWVGFSPDKEQLAEVDLNQTISGTYDQAEVQAISDKVDNILSKLRLAGILEDRSKD